MLESAVWFVHIASAIGVIFLVLLQHGKGADLGASFGSGSAGGLFGAVGASNFLSRTTAVLATVFFSTSLLLTWYSGHQIPSSSVMQGAKLPDVVNAIPTGEAISTKPANVPGNGAAEKPKVIPK